MRTKKYFGIFKRDSPRLKTCILHLSHVPYKKEKRKPPLPIDAMYSPLFMTMLLGYNREGTKQHYILQGRFLRLDNKSSSCHANVCLPSCLRKLPQICPKMGPIFRCRAVCIYSESILDFFYHFLTDNFLRPQWRIMTRALFFMGVVSGRESLLRRVFDRVTAVVFLKWPAWDNQLSIREVIWCILIKPVRVYVNFNDG